MTVQKVQTLTDAKGLGGIIAQDGFDYQVWDALARLPAWLRCPGFEGFAIEALEDFEVRYFAPHTPRRHILERFQAKSGTLSRSELIDVFESFSTFNEAHPDIARVQTLVTPALPTKMAWIARDPGRVRRARPFYEPFSDVLAASDEKLRQDLVKEFSADLGGFYADFVEVDLRTFPDRAHAETAFYAAMHDFFPEIDVSMGRMKAAFSALHDLVAKSRGVMLTRDCLLKVLDIALGTFLIPDKKLRVHIRSDRNGPEADAIEIDASAFTGSGGLFPSLETWHSDLLVPLEATAHWALKHSHQRIVLSGTYRLSTAFAIGWSFRSAIGFEIEIGTRSGPWATDEQPLSDAQLLPWDIVWPKRLVDDRLVVAIGVLRDPSFDIQSSIGILGDDYSLIATLPRVLVGGIEAQTSVQILKVAVSRAVSNLRPKGIDLFFVGPAALAVALGHCWNALPSTQVYEFVNSERRYVPTVILG